MIISCVNESWTVIVDEKLIKTDGQIMRGNTNPINARNDL
jgi:hypothetical protein